MILYISIPKLKNVDNIFITVSYGPGVLFQSILASSDFTSDFNIAGASVIYLLCDVRVIRFIHFICEVYFFIICVHFLDFTRPFLLKSVHPR